MTPELRSAIFSFPLFNSSISEPSDWVPFKSKREILCALQELFVKLAYLNESAISTEALTKSFGWTGEEVIVQHDVQELSRVFFDCLERALENTEFSDIISKFIKGKFVNITICGECGNNSSREEDFADIGLSVKGCKDINESLDCLTKEDILDGNNQYFCENCDKKVNAIRLTKIQKIPPLLYFSLNRFEYDLKTYERVKINQIFEYDLEIDMNKYCEGAGIYELFAVIIHGGSAHSGHYHAYIRDILDQGVWEPCIEKQNIKPDIPVQTTNTNTNTKKGRKNRRKNRKKNQKKVEEPQDYEFQNFSKPCINESLLINWYDFNDSTVTAIKSGKLQKQFGGSNEVAYILIYRSKDMVHTGVPQIPGHWKTVIESLNESYEKHRLDYEEKKQWIEVQLQDVSLFDYDEEVLVYKDKEINPINQGFTLQMKANSTVEDLKNEITIQYIEDYPDFNNTHQIYIAQPLSNKAAHILRPLNSIENDLSLRTARIFHRTCILVLPSGDEKLEQILGYTGESCEPITLNCNYYGEKFALIVNSAWTFIKLKEKISSKISVQTEKLIIKIQKYQGGQKKINPREDESTLSKLKFFHSIQVSISTEEDEIPMKELKKDDTGQELVSVLLFDENLPDKVNQHHINGQWRVKDLIEECRKIFEIPVETPVRLRKLLDKQVIYKEDLDSYLKTIPEFSEGGFRFQVERGAPPCTGEIAVKVALSSDSEPKELFVKESDRISEVKAKAAVALEFEPEKYKLYRTDWLKEAISALKQENHTLFKAAVKDGDLLLAQTLDTVLDTEILKVNLFVSRSPYPMENQFILEISVPEDTTLKKLKEMLVENQEINPGKKEFLRVREITKTLWPGKVYKEDNKSLKKLSISFGSNLLVEPLDKPDALSFTGVFIYITERNSQEKKNGEIFQCFFDVGACPNIDQFIDFAVKVLGKDWGIDEVTVGKYKPQSFEWDCIVDKRSPEERGNLVNSRSSNTAQGIYNLKKQPYLMKDGDLFSIRYDKVEGALEDNFVCETDAVARAEFIKRKQASKKPARVAKPEKSIKIGDF